MVSTFTPFINLEEPARGDYVGTWDLPVNSNSTILDLVVGGQITIGLNNTPVVLSSTQYQNSVITFNSTLTGSVTITFPTSFKKPYKVYHTCTGSSAFTITLQTTAAGGEVVCCPPGRYVDVINDGTNIRFSGLENIGAYWDYAGSSVPNWVSGCTKPPYLNCDGSAFSSVTYPQLAVILGGTTLPDSRGSARYTLNQGTSRLTSSVGGVDGNTLLSAKTTQTQTIVTANLPPYTPSGTITSSVSIGGSNVVMYPGGSNGPVGGSMGNSGVLTVTSSFTGVAQGGTSTPMGVIGTAYVGGLTLIRAG